MSEATVLGKYFSVFLLSKYELNVAFIVQVALGFAFLFTDYIIIIILLCFPLMPNSLYNLITLVSGILN